MLGCFWVVLVTPYILGHIFWRSVSDAGVNTLAVREGTERFKGLLGLLEIVKLHSIADSSLDDAVVSFTVSVLRWHCRLRKLLLHATFLKVIAHQACFELSSIVGSNSDVSWLRNTAKDYFKENNNIFFPNRPLKEVTYVGTAEDVKQVEQHHSTTHTIYAHVRDVELQVLEWPICSW